ncbi:MAG: hypothetical protein RL594_1034 [Bacteroidota bacterium]
MVLLTVELQAQRGFQRLAVEPLVHPQPGYFLFAPNAHDSIGLMDHSGEVVMKFRTGPVGNPRVDAPNTLSHFVVLGSGVNRFGAYILRDGFQQPFDTIYPVGAMNADFHEGRVWSDTSFLLLATRQVPVDLSSVVNGGAVNGRAIECVVQELSFDGRVLFQWNSLDHIAVDQASDENDLLQELVDYLHVNAVERDHDGNLLISCRNTDEVIKVEYPSGKLLWRFGGSASKGNQFRFLNDTSNGFVGFSHQHSMIRTRRGTIMLFDNGNLKPQPWSSRVAEYEIDEVLKTARLVWSHKPNPETFAPTMGSVAELPNGNILIGYGSGSGLAPGKSPVVAEEIRRDGGVDARLRIAGAETVSAYRVMKVQYGMTARADTVKTAGILAGAVGDSSTNIDMVITNVDRPTSVIVEKHHYQPHQARVETVDVCTVLPYRWVIRIDQPAAVAGSLRVSGRGLQFLDLADLLELCWRPTEGQGAFQRLTSATLSMSDSTWTVPELRAGEYCIVSKNCIQPRPLAPIANTVVDAARPTFRIAAADGATGYDLQVARDPEFAVRPITIRIVDTSHAFGDSLVQGVQYFWRVRRVRNASVGLWSAPESFSIRATRPVLLAPVTYVDGDTAVLPVDRTLRWRSFPAASSYRVQVVGGVGKEPIIDTVTNDTTIAVVTPMNPSERYDWSVRADIGGQQTEAAVSVFGTLPTQPRFLLPDPSVFLARDEPLRVVTRPFQGADSAIVEVWDGPGRVRVTESRIASRQAELRGLAAGEDLRLVLAAHGRYGTSRSEPRIVRLVEREPLARPEIVQPIQGDAIRVGARVTFEWQPVSEADSYHVQVATGPAFDSPLLDTVLGSTIVTAQLPAEARLLQWRVQPRRRARAGAWSDTTFVTLRSTEPLELVPVVPVHGASAAAIDGIFSVTPPRGDMPLIIQYSQDPYLDTLDGAIQSATPTANYRGLRSSTTYYWRAAAIQDGIVKPIGPIGVFRTTATSDVVNDVESRQGAVWFDASVRMIRFSEPVNSMGDIQVVDLQGRKLDVQHHGEHLIALTNTSVTTLPRIVFVCATKVNSGHISSWAVVVW